MSILLSTSLPAWGMVAGESISGLAQEGSSELRSAVPCCILQGSVHVGGWMRGVAVGVQGGVASGTLCP